MQSYGAISAMYHYYSFTHDPAQATDAVTTLWNESMESFAQLPEDQRQHKVTKLLAMADAEPSPRFGELLRSIASGAGAPAMPDERGVLRQARLSPVLLRETPIDSLERVLDPVGRVANSLVEPFTQANRVEPAVAVRARQRVARGLVNNGFSRDFTALLQEMMNNCGVSMEALWRAADWFELPQRFLDTDRMVDNLAREAQSWLALQLAAPPELDQRTKNELKPARYLLQLLAATKPTAFPVFFDHPGLEDHLARALHRESGQIELSLAALEMTKKLADVFSAFKERGYAAVDEFTWSAEDPQERLAALAYCCIGNFLEAWEDKIVPQMERVILEEARGRWAHRLDRNPHDVAALRGRAHTWLAENNAVAALQDMTRAADLQPSAANLRDYAVLLGNAGRHVEAQSAVTRALACEDLDPLMQARLYAVRGDLHLKLKQPLQGWGDTVRATLLAPNDAIVRKVHETASLAEQSAWCDALPTLAVPAGDLIPIMRAHELMKLARWDEADEVLRELLGRHPEQAQLRSSLALVVSLRAQKTSLLAQLSAVEPQAGQAPSLDLAAIA